MMRARSSLYAAYERAGFTLVRANNHAIWRCPCGHTQLAAPRTPSSGHRSHQNSAAQIARTLRECKKRAGVAA